MKPQRGNALLGLIVILGMLAAIGAGIYAWGESRYTAGEVAQRAVDQKAVDQIKAKARADLAAEQVKTAAAEKALTDFKATQEVKDAHALQTNADLARRLRDAGQLRDPFAKPQACRCGSGGGGAPGQSAAAAGPGAADGTQTDGLLSAGFTDLLLGWAASADTINAAYASCRADSASLRATLKAWAAEAPGKP